MSWRRLLAAIVVSLALHSADRADAQLHRVYPPAPYGYGLNTGVVGPGYRAGYGLNHRAYYGGGYGAQTVTDYQSLINAITSIPGWYGPAAPHTYHPVQIKPTMSRHELLKDDGSILWPSATPNDSRVAPSKHAAEEAVKLAVAESRKDGHATVRHVADARNKLTAFAGHSLPALKAKNAADADNLERFIVELKKTLATLALNY